MDTLAALASWSGLQMDQFVRPSAGRPEPESLAIISAQLRSDPNLTPDAQAMLDDLVKVTYQRLRRG